MNTVPIAVVMISLNEAHNMDAVCDNVKGWAQQVFLVDSFSKDDTVSIALQHGVHVVQRPFTNFGDQWNFAINELPITTPWTMKLDPDERISNKLKQQISDTIRADSCDGIVVSRCLWFMERRLPIRQNILRVWRTGSCRFTDVAVNEHPVVKGQIVGLDGELEHHDSPDLEHWLEKQNRYTTAEAIIAYEGHDLAATPKLFGTTLQRRMWLKKFFRRIPFRFVLLFVYYYLVRGCWRAGWVGWTWSWLRSDVMRFREIKRREMELLGRRIEKREYRPGAPDSRVRQFE